LDGLKKTLDGLYETYAVGFLSTDPLELVRRYEDPKDQEIVGFVAAVLSLGRTELIRRAVGEVLHRMGASPFRFVAAFDPVPKLRDRGVFDGFVYRFYRGRDVGLLVWWLKQVIDQKGSIQSFFLEGYDEEEDDVGPALSRFVRRMLALETEPFYGALPLKGVGVRRFLSDPLDGSGCKRLNLFLRWMVRRDGLDLGLWQEVSPSKLVIPLDTHVARIGRRIGLTRRSSNDWRTALEITETLRRFDPYDPVKYDFALCRVGMLNVCPAVPDREGCSDCPVFRFCEVSG